MSKDLDRRPEAGDGKYRELDGGNASPPALGGGPSAVAYWQALDRTQATRQAMEPFDRLEKSGA